VNRIFGVFVIILLLISGNIFAQQPVTQSDDDKPRSLNGFRVGATYIFFNDGPNGIDEKDALKDQEIDTPLFAQIGWQFERQYASSSKGAMGVTELVVLLGGFNQGKIIPSISGLVGFRLENGFEFGGGPNISLSKKPDRKGGGTRIAPGFVWASGFSTIVGNLYIPLNLAIVQTDSGIRLTILTGFVY